jgi:hypothetical protein
MRLETRTASRMTGSQLKLLARFSVPAFLHSGIPAFRHSGIPAFRHSGILAFAHFCISKPPAPVATFCNLGDRQRDI